MDNKLYKRGPVLITVFSLFILIDFIKIIFRITLFFTNSTPLIYSFINLSIIYLPFSLPYPIMPILNILVFIFSIILMLNCIMKLNIKAFNIYVILTVIEAFMQLIYAISEIIDLISNRIGISIFNFIGGKMFPFVIKIVLLIIIYLMEVRHFDQGKQ